MYYITNDVIASDSQMQRFEHPGKITYFVDVLSENNPLHKYGIFLQILVHTFAYDCIQIWSINWT